MTLTLPPPQYARKGGEIVAAQLAKVGVVAKIENVEWAQWLSGPFKGNFDLTIISHVEPLTTCSYANTVVLLGLRQQGLSATWSRQAHGTRRPEGARLKLLGDMQRHARHRLGQRVHLPAAAVRGRQARS